MAVAEPSKLYLVIETGPAASDRLAAALAGATPASLLLVAPRGKPLEAQAVLPLIAMAQAQGIAVMLADDAQLVRTTKADGCHLTWTKGLNARVSEAREILGTRYMLGVDVGRSRHDAMELGEAGVDYIAFGIPPHVEDRETATQRQSELIDWWGAIFEVPCVAFDIETAEDAERLAGLGADFVALRIPSGGTADDVKRLVEDADRRLAAIAEPAA